MKSALLMTMLCLACIDTVTASSKLIEADFVAGPKINAYKGDIQRGGYWACSGEIVTVKTDRIPDKSFMTGDDIHEIDAKGRVLRTWAVPLEARPVGISGSVLFIEINKHKKATTVSVNMKGYLRKVKARPTVPDTAISECPVIPTLPESDYRWCATLPDASTPGKKRILAFEGPCT